MRSISKQELRDILDKHGKWIRSESGGVQANLSGANLITFQFNRHFAYCTLNGSITIGCHTHTYKFWLTNYKKIGKKEGYTAQEVSAYGTFIKTCSKLKRTKPKK